MFFTMMHSFSGFHFFRFSHFNILTRTLLLWHIEASLFPQGWNKQTSNTHQNGVVKYKNDILADGILSSLSPAQSTRPKEEHGGCVHSHAYTLVRAWQECHLTESSLGYGNVLRVSVLQIEGCVKTDALFGIEILNGSLSTAHLQK